MVRKGDFRIPSFAEEFAEEVHMERSRRAQASDEARRAPITTQLDMWQAEPSRFDFPGVDTPTENPSLLPKDLMQAQKPATGAGPEPLSPEERESAAEESRAGFLGLDPELFR